MVEVSLPAVFEDLDIGITLHEPSTGDILDVNEQLAELYGYTAEELRTMAVEDYSAPSSKFTQAEAVQRIRSAADGNPQEFEWQITRANGELRWVNVHLSSTTIDGVQCVVGEIHDVTEYRAREHRLRLLSRIVRHNLRNDMNVIMAYADQVKRAIEEDTLQESVDTILDIATEVGTLSNSVQQIEEIAEPDATERTATNLGEVARSLADQASAEYPDASLTVDAPTEVRVIADKGLDYAIEHAIKNAIEHNDQKEPELTITVTHDQASEFGVIRIADNGPSIPAIETNVLDDEVTTSSTYHGTGVGLWVMKWCIDSLGGKLTFEENSPRGNIVSIAVPSSTALETD